MVRYALVIGIAQYKYFRNLQKTITDASAIASVAMSSRGDRLGQLWQKDEWVLWQVTES